MVVVMEKVTAKGMVTTWAMLVKDKRTPSFKG